MICLLFTRVEFACTLKEFESFQHESADPREIVRDHP